jgi:hypothetical protein
VTSDFTRIALLERDLRHVRANGYLEGDYFCRLPTLKFPRSRDDLTAILLRIGPGGSWKFVIIENRQRFFRRVLAPDRVASFEAGISQIVGASAESGYASTSSFKTSIADLASPSCMKP